MADRQQGLTSARTFLTSLARDVRANTLAIMTMSLIPLAGMVGGGVDISRMYIVKTRLQHACDAGALAGRKMMGGGTWANSNYAARTAAEKFFDANYNTAAYGATNVTRSYSESAGKVSGTATAVLPMTLMRIFGRTTETLTVVCDAEMRLPNTDVMFVLDTTGSMDETPSGDNKTKIAGLRIAVKCFYQIVARLDITDTDCEGDEPSGGTGNQVQIRFGFMPYSVNVNVGKLLKPEWFADSWTYQSRRALTQSSGSGSWVQNGNPVITTESFNKTDVPYSYCNDETAAAAGYNSSSEVLSEQNNKKTTTTVYTDVTGWNSNNDGTCFANRITTVTVYQWNNSGGNQTFLKWRYEPVTHNVSGLKNGTGWNNSFTLNLGANGTAKAITWNGCIEERKTNRTTDYDPIPADAYDLDFDLVPTSNNETKWGPALPGVIYTRNATGNNTSNWSFGPSETTADYGNGSSFTCPNEARRLQTWPSASDFDAYVDGLTTGGNTYHDIGLLWGARFASPTGLFATDNAFTSQGGEIERHIIFMTDGDTNTGNTNYNAYGIPWYDRRQTDINSVPSQAQLDQQVDLRFAALCQKIKNATFNGKGAYTLWVISFGTVTADTQTRLQNCATSGRYFSASNSATLQSTFKSIADQISQLRLTR
jgi:Flp pilus assembly protein TadG